MVETQIVKENDRPIAVVIDYEEYCRLKEIEQNVEDYEQALYIKKTNTEWIKHDDMKKELGL